MGLTHTYQIPVLIKQVHYIAWTSALMAYCGMLFLQFSDLEQPWNFVYDQFLTLFHIPKTMRQGNTLPLVLPKVIPDLIKG